MSKLFSILLMAFMVLPLPSIAQSTRSDLAQIRVTKEGNFKYWSEDSPALAQLKDFVGRVTDENGADYVPAEHRIAAFDVDGTLICETAPFYVSVMLAFQRFLHDESFTPTPEQRELMQQYEDYLLKKSNDASAIGKVSIADQKKAFRGMTRNEYIDYASHFLDHTPMVGLTNLTWGTALYWPMIEVVSYLVANDFKVYVNSGVERDLCRAIVQDVLEIPFNHILASDVHYVTEAQAAQGQWTESIDSESYAYTPGEKLVRGDWKQNCTALNKIVIMERELGMRPILSWGNSSGDYPMFHHTNIDNPYPHLSFCLLCDDTTRELGNPAKAEKCKANCDEYGWVPVSMSREWTTIYGDDVQLASPSSVSTLAAQRAMISSIFNLSGQPVTDPRAGEAYIENGVKKVVTRP